MSSGFGRVGPSVALVVVIASGCAAMRTGSGSNIPPSYSAPPLPATTVAPDPSSSIVTGPQSDRSDRAPTRTLDRAHSQYKRDAALDRRTSAECPVQLRRRKSAVHTSAERRPGGRVSPECSRRVRRDERLRRCPCHPLSAHVPGDCRHRSGDNSRQWLAERGHRTGMGLALPSGARVIGRDRP